MLINLVENFKDDNIMYIIVCTRKVGSKSY